MRKVILVVWLAFIGMSMTVSGQEGSFFVQVSKDTVLVGNVVEVTFVADNIAGRFEAPEFQNIQILSGPNTSTSMSMINGSVSQRATYTYILNTEDIGSLVIPPGYLDTDDGALESDPIEVLVLPNPEGIIEQRPNQSGFFEFKMPSRSVPMAPTSPRTEKKKKRKLKKF